MRIKPRDSGRSSENIYNNFTLRSKMPTVEDSNAVCVELLREKGLPGQRINSSYALDRTGSGPAV